MTTDGQSRTTSERLNSVVGGLFSLPALLGLLAVGIYAVGDATFAEAPSSRDPGFVDAVLASSAVLAAVRLAIIAAAVYVVFSVVALVARRQWLTRVGPVEVSARVSDLEREIGALRNALDDAEGRADYLEKELATAEDTLEMACSSLKREWGQ